MIVVTHTHVAVTAMPSMSRHLNSALCTFFSLAFADVDCRFGDDSWITKSHQEVRKRFSDAHNKRQNAENFFLGGGVYEGDDGPA